MSVINEIVYERLTVPTTKDFRAIKVGVSKRIISSIYDKLALMHQINPRFSFIENIRYV